MMTSTYYLTYSQTYDHVLRFGAVNAFMWLVMSHPTTQAFVAHDNYHIRITTMS